MSKHSVAATLRQNRAADNLADSTMTIKDALLLAGYAKPTACRGMAAVSAPVLKLMAKKGLRLRALGEIDTETQEKITRGRLVYNVIRGKDSGVNSCKLLGSDKRISMFAADTQIGVIVLNQPGVATLKAEAILQAPSDSAQ